MGKYEKLLLQILRGDSDANISFAELCNLLDNLGFEKRVGGSHTLFNKEGVEEIINLQRLGDKAKAYQVRQIRKVLVKYKLLGG